MGKLIDADELIKDDEVTLWLSNDAVRTGKTLKTFSELFIKKINEQPPVEAIPKAEYETRLKADMVAMLEELKKEMNPIKECEHQIYGKEEWNFVGKCQDIIDKHISGSEDNNAEHTYLGRGVKIYKEEIEDI